MVDDGILKAVYKGIVTPKYEEKLLAKFMECKEKFGKTLAQTQIFL